MMALLFLLFFWIRRNVIRALNQPWPEYDIEWKSSSYTDGNKLTYIRHKRRTRNKNVDAIVGHH